MPHYDYYCENCKATNELWYSMQNKPDTITCQFCGKIAHAVISSGQGFHLKGHGWGFDRYAGRSNFSNYGKDDE